MMKVEFEAVDIPFYYMCSLAMIHEQIKRKGSLSYVTLYPSSQLFGIPVYSSDGFILNPERIAGELGVQMGHCSLEKKSFPDLEQGLDYLRECLDQEQTIIVQGTSYSLPFHDDYRNPRYIEKFLEPGAKHTLSDHWLTVYGLEDGEVLIYDPVPFQFKGGISLEEFNSFWLGNRNIDALRNVRGYEHLASYAITDVKVEMFLSDTNIEDYFHQILQINALQFAKGSVRISRGRALSFGRMAAIRLLSDIEEAFRERPDRLPELAKPIFNTRWPRYYFRDLLQEMSSLFGEPYSTLAANFLELIGRWEEEAKLYLLYVNKGQFDKQQFLALKDRMNRLIEEEDCFFRSIIELTLPVDSR